MDSFRQHSLALRLQVAGEPYLVQEENGWHRLGYNLQGRCFFLQGKNLCGLHASTGWYSKPRACRQFPFFLLDTPDGVQVGLSFRCSAVQQDQGVEWSRHEADLTSLVESGNYPRVGFEPIAMGLGSVDWSLYKEWESEWLKQLALGRSLEWIFWRHLSEKSGLALDAQSFADLLDRWTLSALALLREPPPPCVAEVGSSLDSIRYWSHVLERKSLWLGDDLLGRMLLVLVAERLLFCALAESADWGRAFDLVEGQWLAHRDDLGPVERGLAATLLQYCLR